MQRISSRALEALGLAGEAVSGELRIAAQGNRLVSLSGVRMVRRYTPDCLRLQVVGGVVRIEGFELMLRAICAGVVEVCGKIDLIGFEMDAQEEER